MKIKNTYFVDCTLRDGSYNNNFNFSPSNTKELITNLKKINFKHIEIGHGLGLGAFKQKKFFSKYSDEMILSQILKNKSIGVFYIPGMGSPCDIEMAKKYGVNFIKIGTNPNSVNDQFKVIDQCNDINLYPISFIMKSHLLKPKEFAKKANMLFKHGSKLVYLVDSMGCMTPEDIKNYFYETKRINSKIKLGFHGHDNLGLATINSLVAFDLNFYMIDMTLQGIGRSGGNLCTEKFISILKKKNKIKINLKKLFEFSKLFIDKTNAQNIPNIIDILFGYKKIHSGDLPKLLKKKGSSIFEKILRY
jgi:4-hydroxy-2-oxovalerate aldolase